MNLKYYYWFFKSAIPERICDEIVRYGQEQEKQMALTGDSQKDNLSNASCWVIGWVNFLFLARIGSRINCFLFVALKKMRLKLVEIRRVNSIDDRNGVCR